MASLLDKLTGKAPMKDDTPETDKKETEVKGEAEKSEKKSKKKEAKEAPVGGNKKPSKYNIEDFKTIGRWLVPIGLCSIVLVATYFVGGKLNEPYVNTLEEQKQEYIQMVNEIDIRNNEFKSMESAESLMQEYHFYEGENSETFKKDKEIAEKFFRKYCTWNSGEEYESLRNELLTYDLHNDGEYEYSDTSTFICCVLPKQYTYTSDETHVTYYSLDAYEKNMKFSNLVQYPLAFDVDAASMNYAGILTLTYRETDSKGFTKTKEHNIYVTYSVADDTLVNVNAALLVD